MLPTNVRSTGPNRETVLAMNERQRPYEIEILHRVSDEFGQRCVGLDEDDFSLPTPCTEWDVGQLTDHVLGGNWFTINILNGATAEEAMAAAMKMFTADLDRAEAFASSSRAQCELFAEPAILERQFSHVVGDLSGANVLTLRIHELIIHGWDLSHAVAPPATIAADLVSWALEELAAPNSLMARHFKVDRTALDRPTDPLQRLLSSFGRTL